MNEKLPDRALQSRTWARTECHGGRPIFFFYKKKSVTQLFGEMSRNCLEKCHRRENQDIGPHCPEGTIKFQACLFPGNRCPPSLMWIVNIFP